MHPDDKRTLKELPLRVLGWGLIVLFLWEIRDRPHETPLDHVIWSMAMATDLDGGTVSARVFAGTDGAVYVTDDWGEKWEKVGTTDSPVTAIGADTRGHVFAGTLSGSIYQSDWPAGSHRWASQKVSEFPISSLTVYGGKGQPCALAGTFGGGVLSYDSSEALWKSSEFDLGADKDIVNLTFDLINKVLVIVTVRGWYLTKNWGKSWEASEPPQMLRGLAVDGHDDALVVMQGRVFLRNHLKKDPLELLDAQSRRPLRSAWFVAANSGTDMILGTSTNVFKSHDGGDTWTVMSSNGTTSQSAMFFQMGSAVDVGPTVNPVPPNIGPSFGSISHVFESVRYPTLVPSFAKPVLSASVPSGLGSMPTATLGSSASRPQASNATTTTPDGANQNSGPPNPSPPKAPPSDSGRGGGESGGGRIGGGNGGGGGGDGDGGGGGPPPYLPFPTFAPSLPASCQSSDDGETQTQCPYDNLARYLSNAKLAKQYFDWGTFGARLIASEDIQVELGEASLELAKSTLESVYRQSLKVSFDSLQNRLQKLPQINARIKSEEVQRHIRYMQAIEKEAVEESHTRQREASTDAGTYHNSHLETHFGEATHRATYINVHFSGFD